MGVFGLFRKEKVSKEEDERNLFVAAEYTCENSSHDFLLKQKNNLSEYYCRKCKMSVKESPYQRLNMTYLGSYIDGYSWVWQEKDMCWENIADFFIRINNFEQWSYDVSVKGVNLVWKKSAPFRPDLPKDFFNEHKIKLTQEQRNKLCVALSQLDFSKISVKPSDFDIQLVPNMCGSTYTCIFRCTFKNGRGFECGQIVKELKNVEHLLLGFMGITVRDFAMYKKALEDI